MCYNCNAFDGAALDGDALYRCGTVAVLDGAALGCVFIKRCIRWGCSSSAGRCSLTSWWTGRDDDLCSSPALAL